MTDDKRKRGLIILVKVYKFLIQQFKDPIFAIALSLSVIMWFLNTLSGNFTAVISIPIRVTGVVNKINDDKNATEKSDNEFTIDCKLSGKGFNILYYSLISHITINTAEIKIVKSQSGEYTIDIPSLESKMNEKLIGVTLINVFQKRLSFRTLTYSSKLVPIDLNVDIKNDGQFMQVGDIVLEPSHVLISGNISKLDSIQMVKTDYFRVENKEKNISGEVELIEIPGTTYSNNKVYYAINFQRFTEKKIKKRIEIRNGNGERYTVIPSHVEVTLNIAESIFYDFNHFNFPLYIDIKDKESNNSSSSYIGDNKFIVEYKHLPKGVNVRATSPKHVTILKGGIEGRKVEESNTNRYSENIFNLLEVNKEK